jgi:cystathionine gamma-synthase
MRAETLAIHADGGADPATGAVAPPLHLSTTFEHAPDGARRAGFEYQREDNPTQARLESTLAAMEGGEAALVFGSGMAAIATVLQGLPSGAGLLIPADCYTGLRVLAGEFLADAGVRVITADMRDADAVAQAMDQGVHLVWCETPSNPLLQVSDIAALAGIAHQRGARLVCDNTFASPALQNPLALGADLVMHSTTKYLGGHSDVMGGALVFAKRAEWHAEVFHRRHITGSIAAPFNSWLILRGCRSLHARMRVHSENAFALARFLAGHSAIEAVHYPGLASHPGHAIAARQMRSGGGMLSVQLRGGRDAALAAAGRLRLFTNATSLGGVESLVEHRASIEGAHPTSPQNLLRLSVGLEHVDDLIEDWAQALQPLRAD